MADSLRHATLADIVGWLLRRYRRFRVTGDSMQPLLTPGQEVLMDPHAFQARSPQPDDIVIAQHPHQSGLCIIKRIAFVESDGSCYLKGDNAGESSDSRQFGLISSQRFLGKVICHFP
jgi:nickel-type superoxide dismutase maturation protease